MKEDRASTTEGASAPSEEPPTPGFTPFVIGMDAVGALIVLGMMIIVNVDVFGRWLFDAPLSGTFELTEMGVVLPDAPAPASTSSGSTRRSIVVGSPNTVATPSSTNTAAPGCPSKRQPLAP